MPPSDSLDANTQALQALSQAVYNYESSFCVGGQIPIQTQATQAAADTNAQASTASATKSTPLVILHWTLPNEAPRALTLQFSVPEADSETFNQLLQACDPATFRRGQKDVLDETYRKAGKLDNTQFTVSFHPADHGILDTIVQTLLPTLFPNDKRADHHGVLAELYKLNVYSGPGGKFKAHVDTPRGETQFGSLVVCLPAKFEGGQLRVSHKGISNLFDWGCSNPDAIQWAAFYSDCEHEILEVTDGHRITLTYNLYFTQRIDATLQAFPSVDPHYFPFFKVAQAMLKNPDFFPQGGTIGCRCVHRYPHTSGTAKVLMPHAFKGLDCIFLSVFRALGLRTKAQPVLEDRIDDDYYGDDEDEDEENNDIGRERLGTAFHETVQSNDDCEELNWKEQNDAVENNWPHERKHVHWLRGANGVHKELAIVGIAYGNQASLDTTYSHAAIIVTISKIGEEGRTWKLG